MPHKGSTKLIHQNSSVGRGNGGGGGNGGNGGKERVGGGGKGEFSNIGLEENEDNDGDPFDSKNRRNSNKLHNHIVKDVELEGETMAVVRSQQLRLTVLVWIFVEKFFEILVVFFLTLLAIWWVALFNFIQRIFWPLIGFIAISMIALIGLNRIPWFTRAPGCLLYKLLYLVFLTAVFFILAIHFPMPLPFLSSYFALIAAGTAAATYILLAFIAVTHKHICKVDAKGCALWLYGMIMPLVVLLISQPIYFYGGISQQVEYKSYMVNITAGILVSLPFTYETLFIYQSFVNSNIWEEFARTPGLLPGFVTAFAQRRDTQVKTTTTTATKNGDDEIKMV